jgi:hypothetical protein
MGGCPDVEEQTILSRLRLALSVGLDRGRAQLEGIPYTRPRLKVSRSSEAVLA